MPNQDKPIPQPEIQPVSEVPETQPVAPREVSREVPETKEMPQPAERVEEEQVEQEAVETAPPPQVAAPAPPAAPVVVKDKLTQQVESVLAADLEELYVKMSPKEKIAFKEAGEETASKIVELLRQTKVKVRKVRDAIRKWLRMIPGVNRFFLEKEAKIKTEKLLLISEEEKRKQETEV